MFAQIQFAKLPLAVAAQQFAAQTALRFQIAPEGFIGVPQIHAALKFALLGWKVGEWVHGYFNRASALPITSSSVSSGSSQMNSAWRTVQSRLLIWSQSTTPRTGNSGGSGVSKG